MKFIIFISLILFFSACNESNSSDSNQSDENPNPLSYQQWSIKYDESFYRQNGIDSEANINIEDSFTKYSGKGIKVAVIDDGFDINHPEIKDKIVKTASVDNSGNVSSDATHVSGYDSHGTAVAGIIAASDNNIGIMGIAPDVELILIRYPYVLSDDVVIEMFEQALDAGADVINCSWGTNNVSDTIRDYINHISTYGRDGKGVIVVFASGNFNEDISTDESSISSVIGVGATDKDNLRTNYSNFGKDLDIVAPGGYTLGITTLDPIGNNGSSIDGYNRYNENTNGKPVSFIGTSASAPIISGVIALGLEKNSDLTREEIQEVLKKSTNTIGNNTPYIYDMIISSEQTPVISGLFGASGNSTFSVRVIAGDETVYGPYSVNSIGNNEWSTTVTDSLENGFYTLEVIDNESEDVFATDEHFEVNTQKTSLKDKTKRKSDFYGYGKIDVEKFLSNIH